MLSTFIRRISWCLLCIASLVVGPVQAGTQLDFKRTEKTHCLLLDYRLQALSGVVHDLRLVLDKRTVKRAAKLFQPLDTRLLQQQIDEQRYRKTTDALNQFAREYPQLEFELTRSGDVRWQTSISEAYQQQRKDLFAQIMDERLIEIKRRFPKARISRTETGAYELFAASQTNLRRIQQALEAAMQYGQKVVADNDHKQQQLLKSLSQDIGQRVRGKMAAIAQDMQNFEHDYYRARGYQVYQNQSLMPDYAGIAKASMQDISRLARYLRPWLAGLSQREAINLLLLLVQSIPYDALQDRASDAGFLPPLSVLAQNRGDCDSKSVLFATLLHKLYPSLPIAMILLEQHALLGIGVPVEKDDMTWHHANRDWVLAEPVGPGLLPLGQAGEEFREKQQAVEVAIRLF
jgi:FixJ family two-component response regulator